MCPRWHKTTLLCILWTLLVTGQLSNTVNCWQCRRQCSHNIYYFVQYSVTTWPITTWLVVTCILFHIQYYINFQHDNFTPSKFWISILLLLIFIGLHMIEVPCTPSWLCTLSCSVSFSNSQAHELLDSSWNAKFLVRYSVSFSLTEPCASLDYMPSCEHCFWPFVTRPTWNL